MLHIPTLMMALLLGFLLLTLELGVSQKGLRARPEIRRWSQGSWAVLVGFLGLSARGVVPIELSILLGNGGICLGLALYAQALCLLLQVPAPRWLVPAQPALWLAMVLMLDWPLNQRTSVLSGAYALLLWPSVQVIAQHGWHAERSLRTVAITMGLAGLVHLMRVWHAWTHPQEYGDLMQASLGQGLTFLLAFMTLLGAGFGFVLAVFERVANRMETLATHDGLTGCWNRTTTDALLEHELRRAQRSATAVAFVLLDLDHFKQVNDQHGHCTGDAVLRAFADTVRARLRSSDVFGRTGGEEFGLVLPGTDAAGALWLVDAIRRATEALVVPGAEDRPVSVTVSAGVAVADPNQPLSGDRLYGQADQALYEAKRSGRNRVEVHGITTGASAALPLA